LCAAPDYLARKGMPQGFDELQSGTHDCLNMRYPGAPEFQWPLQTRAGLRKVAVRGPFESDHGDVLTEWALAGHGIILKPRFEVADHLASGRLVAVLEGEPPLPVQMGCLYPHRKHQDPKVRLFLDFMVGQIQAAIAEKVSG
ncbi:MAG: substrate binding domain-containing protein, partial [Pseudomonadota bacterium]